MSLHAARCVMACLWVCCTAQGIEAAQPQVSRRGSIVELQRAMTSGRLSAEALARRSLDAIDAIDRHGPALHAVLRLNPRALDEARALDRERRAGQVRGPLHGVPVLIKDNIETADPMPTTAGSLALRRNYARRDAPVVAALRSAGMVILGKTNLSEWANYRSTHPTSGWSAVGGLTRNPYVLDRTACGSSSGSAVAVAAGLVPAALGTETDGSVTCPAAMNGIVGLKPTVGLLSQQGIVPISHSQDSAGPMARSVADVALLLSAMTGHDYSQGLDGKGLRGKRLGVLRFDPGKYPETDLVYAHALAMLRAAGAILVDVKPPDMDAIGNAEQQVLLHEFKTDMDAYLARTPRAVTARALSALIAFDYASPDELRFFGQELFVQAEASGGTTDKGYRAALERAKRLAGRDGIDRLLREHQLDALIAPTSTPAWRVDIIYGDPNADAFTTLPAVAGYPHLTVPMGQVDGLPVGLSFIGSAHQEALLLALGADYERQRGAFAAPRFIRSLEPSPAAPAAPGHPGTY